MKTESSAVGRSLIYAGIVGVIMASSPVLAQEAPEAEAVDIAETPVAPGAVIGGEFNSPEVRDLAAHFIRTQGGKCDSISRAEPAASGKVVVSCNENENTYYMQRKGKAWSFTLPAGAGR